jgi:hypothetical protein
MKLQFTNPVWRNPLIYVWMFLVAKMATGSFWAFLNLIDSGGWFD